MFAVGTPTLTVKLEVIVPPGPDAEACITVSFSGLNIKLDAPLIKPFDADAVILTVSPYGTGDTLDVQVIVGIGAGVVPVELVSEDFEQDRLRNTTERIII